jgi:hypothetical protein
MKKAGRTLLGRRKQCVLRHGGVNSHDAWFRKKVHMDGRKEWLQGSRWI